jgi:hypothetical protein
VFPGCSSRDRTCALLLFRVDLPFSNLSDGLPGDFRNYINLKTPRCLNPTSETKVVNKILGSGVSWHDPRAAAAQIGTLNEKEKSVFLPEEIR